jgi:GNAT superfamily N-acetyltransferase
MTSTDRSDLRIERLVALDPAAVEPLVVESTGEGYRLVRRLVDDWTDGSNRFDACGESLWAAREDERLIGVCGVNVDPFAADPRVCRLRHLYVLRAYRRRGAGRRLVAQACVSAGPHFDRMRLRTKSLEAAEFYLCLGFRAETDTPMATHSRALPAGLEGLAGV